MSVWLYVGCLVCSDDFVCAFQYARDAERFYKALPKRLERFNLEVAEDKTRCIHFSRFRLGLKQRFTFLSFEYYWNADNAGEARLFRRTARKKMQATKQAYTEFIKKNRHLKTPILLGKLTQKLRGYYNYFGVVGNLDSLYNVYSHAVGLLYKWLNRRSGRKSMTWAKLKRLLAYRAVPLPVVKARNPNRRMKW